MQERLAAVCRPFMQSVREEGGRHEFDGEISDLSPSGVRSMVEQIGSGELDDADLAHVKAFEDLARVWFGDLEVHRWNPDLHMRNLNLVQYERHYAPERERSTARLRHLAQWPEAVDMALQSMDRVSAPMARAMLSSAQGLHAQVDRVQAGGVPDDLTGRAHRSVDRLVDHLSGAVENGDPSAALGAGRLAQLMTASEALEFDVAEMTAVVERETARLTAMLQAACARIDAAAAPRDVVRRLLSDRPRSDQEILENARRVTTDLVAFTQDRALVPWLDGEMEFGMDQDAQGLFFANMRFCAPEEPDSPATYHLTPPDWSWPQDDINEWLETFSPALIGSMSAHEAAPGHFAHARALRRVDGLPRRILMGYTFAEGWAHYAEELCVEEGFSSDDPRFEIGMCIWALVRVTRLASAIGLHDGSMTIQDSVARFMDTAYFPRPAAIAEANRGLFDPMYARFTWGKLVIRETRERARAAWGSGFSLGRFHAALFELGSPPIGLIGSVVDRPSPQ
jgi:hypothetical protein